MKIAPVVRIGGDGNAAHRQTLFGLLQVSTLNIQTLWAPSQQGQVVASTYLQPSHSL